ncbi:DUF55-domain-containing protein [Coniophora puteana RWD-64-598 SS2]|uniref:DUF55-domain-containing protein n=1 Tax=Coniophora puteana (strain RWD-64-598) TaxID=741705 RepID=A0A5M3MBE0_CONPW|nr:DUF55-domain-containing protein [Coniophora puteana RWD-64-598 SS2]EIW76204.1 DUF55-domain-containing protein [Coniophora puteana RWD-64-598 SS2]
MKAEPDSRIVKGKDVKFGVDDFEEVKTTPWEGVRNFEARNLMQSMSVGDKVLFYHSNCKSPGIAGFAEIAKEAYPDYTAWDSSHPYFDPKTKQDAPKWHMVDVAFKSRAAHFVPLALLRRIADSTSPSLPAGIEYLSHDNVQAIKGMALVTRGRLSVQPVEEGAWAAIELLADRGGWSEDEIGVKKGAAAKKATTKAAAPKRGKKTASKKSEKADEERADEGEASDPVEQEDKEVKPKANGSRKRKADEGEPQETRVTRQSTRRKA